MALGQLDEVAVDLVPVVMGEGNRPIFGNLSAEDMMLGNPTLSVHSDRVIHLVFPWRADTVGAAQVDTSVQVALRHLHTSSELGDRRLRRIGRPRRRRGMPTSDHWQFQAAARREQPPARRLYGHRPTHHFRQATIVPWLRRGVLTRC